MVPLSVFIVTIRVSPAGSAAGWVVGQPSPAPALADGPPDGLVDGAEVGAAPPPDAEQAARTSVARMVATAELVVREREVMRQPPGQRGSRAGRTGAPRRRSRPPRPRPAGAGWRGHRWRRRRRGCRHRDDG